MKSDLKNRLIARLAKNDLDALLSVANSQSDSLERFVQAITHLCPFAGRLIQHDQDRLQRVFAADVEDLFEALLPSSDILTGDLSTIKSDLRRCRNDMALALLFADLSGVLNVRQVTEALSRLADRAINIALCAGIQSASALRGVVFDAGPTDKDGISIIAMGKLGARELNYSSDIDLVAIYKPEKIRLSPDSRLDAKGFAVKAVQIMVDVLNEQTSDGFVFRTDMRLRPNPGTTSVAVSISSAERYYEAYGQNWERAAFIKARLCAGDEELGAQFIELMKRFVWRRTLDFGAVADIYAVKKQIHAEKGRPDLEVPGADVKLGPGGIREVEFFAQTQQLILGGRNRTLQSPRTEEALQALQHADHIDADTTEKMIEAYWWLRNIEHRLQMKEDAQTQTLPSDREGLSEIALLMNLHDVDSFISRTKRHMRIVHDAYADLFDTPEPQEPVPGSLVFTGVEDDPRTLETLRKIGFSHPEKVTDRIRRWHQGGIRSTRSQKARELLTALVPRMLMDLGELPDPDGGFDALDQLLGTLPAGFQVFSLFIAYPEVMGDVLALCQASPGMAKKFGNRPQLMEGLLEGLDVSPPSKLFTEPDTDIELALDIVRRVVNGHRVRAEAALILGQARPHIVAQALAKTADIAIADIVSAVWRDAELHGKAPTGELSVLGFGRLGIQELTVASDLDLVFVYELEYGTEEEEKKFTRLVRRIVSALSVPTAEGGLYTIDMQLRPSGGAGPTAVAFSTFHRYYQNTAWTWEMMALTKARVVYSTGHILKEKIENCIDQHLMRERDVHQVKSDIIEMRQRLLREKPPRTNVDLKRMPGGLTDIEFIVQYQHLVSAHEDGPFPAHPVTALRSFSQLELIEESAVDELVRAYELFSSTLHFLRMTEGTVPPAQLLEGKHSRIRKLSDEWSEAPIDTQINQSAERVQNIFEKLIGPYSALS